MIKSETSLSFSLFCVYALVLSMSHTTRGKPVKKFYLVNFYLATEETTSDIEQGWGVPHSCQPLASVVSLSIVSTLVFSKIKKNATMWCSYHRWSMEKINKELNTYESCTSSCSLRVNTTKGKPVKMHPSLITFSHWNSKIKNAWTKCSKTRKNLTSHHRQT